jgi:hypothetical protein
MSVPETVFGAGRAGDPYTAGDLNGRIEVVLEAMEGRKSA